MLMRPSHKNDCTCENTVGSEGSCLLSLCSHISEAIRYMGSPDGRGFDKLVSYKLFPDNS
jgi:hypothetical protein